VGAALLSEVIMPDVFYVPGKPVVEYSESGVSVRYPVQTLYSFGGSPPTTPTMFKGDITCASCGESREGDEPNDELCWSCYCESMDEYDDD
jgi:hypothetical protein